MILLDTHVWLWWLHTPEQLSEPNRTLLTICENQNAVYSAIALLILLQNAIASDG